jgi:hypothetical protein
MGKTLGKENGSLVVGVNLKHNNLTRLHMAPEEVVPFDMEVLGRRDETSVGCQKEGAIVVLKGSTMEWRQDWTWDVEEGDQFNNHPMDGNEILCGGGQGGTVVLAFDGTESDFVLKLGLPKEGYTT